MQKKAVVLMLLVTSLTRPLITEASTLYRCVDEFGRTTYTNYKAGNRKCSVLSRDDTPRAASSSSSGSKTKATPADFPKVAGAMQKSRDGDRRYILDQEVEAETKHLDEARKSLADQLAAQPPGAGPGRVQPMRDRIALHERNLDALRREISNLK
jgi:Domain of unknown function (DUF4124)